MKSFLLILFKFSIAFVLLIFFQFIFFQFILKMNTNFKIEQNKTILILGDSQTEADLNDSIIQNSINFSNSGDPLFFNYIKLKKIIENNDNINTVLLGFSPNNLNSWGFYEAPKMKSMIVRYFFLMNFSDYLDVIKYNFNGFIQGVTGVYRSITKKNFLNKSFLTEVDIGGFRKLPSGTKSLLEKDIKDKKSYNKGKPDKLSIKYFLKIVRICQDNNIRLIVINTPVHKSLVIKQKERKAGYIEYMEKINKNILFWDYENFKMDDIYFYDENHLNVQGANHFSNYINEKISELSSIK